nr:hypothetical protein Iba_scaffold54174CG0010 [Ipomoea batatas]
MSQLVVVASRVPLSTSTQPPQQRSQPDPVLPLSGAICPTVSVNIVSSPETVFSSLAIAASTSSIAPYFKSAALARSYRLSASCRAYWSSSRFFLRLRSSSILSFSLLYFIIRGWSLSLKSSSSFLTSTSRALLALSFSFSRA